MEINADSIGFAKGNAKQNRIKNARFVSMDSTRFMEEKPKKHHDSTLM